MTYQRRNGLRRARLIAAAGGAIALALAGCGGGLEVTSGGIGGSGLVAGPIEEFGSVVVGGIRFDVEDASIVVNGETGTVGDLALGMYVSIYGNFDEEAGTGVASVVDFEESASGPISFVSPDRRRLVVLEQAVRVDDSTRFDGLAPTDLVPGLVVTVSGSRDADGSILATRLARRIAMPGCRVLGEVAELAEDGSSFRIGDLLVDASDAVVVGGALVAGDSVAVFAQACAIDGLLVAAEIRRLDATQPTPGPLRSVRGFVVERLGLGRFRMQVPGSGPLVVQITQRTMFEGGTRDDVIRNALLRVAGSAGVDGVLRASRIVFLEEALSPSLEFAEPDAGDAGGARLESH